ncbi:helix-turn-helix transcriptional regulator [Plantibacter sp. T3]|uniref:helix-turn-helix domain-containing protein n=1 Tax=Plantibacter sp. T3 TaxID=2653161 RepID=UPI00135B22BC|nr:helix-turn-helix transcriptional regulator [Plantibacter sp. T3]
MSTLIRDTMSAAGTSGAELARRLHVTPGAISQLLKSEEDATIKLASLERALRALGKDIVINAVESSSPAARFSPAGVSQAMSDALIEGDRTFALRLLTQAAQKVAVEPDLATDPLFARPPEQLPDTGWDTLFRAHYGRALPDALTARWPELTPLPEPWFISQFDSLRERARTRSPEHLRRLNIFIDEQSLSRA